MSSKDTFISKEKTKHNFSTGRKLFNGGERTEMSWNKTPRFQNEFYRKQDWYAFGWNNDGDIIDILLGKEK